MHQDLEKVLISKEEIDAKVKEIAAELGIKLPE